MKFNFRPFAILACLLFLLSPLAFTPEQTLVAAKRDITQTQALFGARAAGFLSRTGERMIVALFSKSPEFNRETVLHQSSPLGNRIEAFSTRFAGTWAAALLMMAVRGGVLLLWLLVLWPCLIAAAVTGYAVMQIKGESFVRSSPAVWQMYHNLLMSACGFSLIWLFVPFPWALWWPFIACLLISIGIYGSIAHATRAF